MIPLSPRLLTCASMITGRTVCDIGTDHAYLPVWLIQSGKADRVIASDIRKGPLRAAEETVRRFGFSRSIELQLSDGFTGIRTEGITDVVIAGMGGETIRDILSADAAAFLKSGVSLVLQPMTKAEILRIWLAENGFSVMRETAVKDHKVYCIMQAVYSGIRRRISEAESFCGKLNPAEPMTRVYIADVQKRLISRAEGMESAGNTDEAGNVRKLISEISNYLYHTEETDENTANI